MSYANQAWIKRGGMCQEIEKNEKLIEEKKAQIETIKTTEDD